MRDTNPGGVFQQPANRRAWLALLEVQAHDSNGMNAQSTIPIESVSGCIMRQLYHGKPHLVFVQHANGDKPRAAFEVKANGGGWKPTGTRYQFESNANTDPACITAEYLQQVYGRFA